MLLFSVRIKRIHHNRSQKGLQRMTGLELIELIEQKGWLDAQIWFEQNGVCNTINSVEPLFPNLNNTNEIVCSNASHIEVLYDDAFWAQFYGSYMTIITTDEARQAVKDGNPSFYILHKDGTEGIVDDRITEDQFDEMMTWDVWFGYEK